MDIATAVDSESDPEQSKLVRNPLYCLQSAGTTSGPVESDTDVAIESSDSSSSEDLLYRCNYRNNYEEELQASRQKDSKELSLNESEENNSERESCEKNTSSSEESLPDEYVGPKVVPKQLTLESSEELEFFDQNNNQSSRSQSSDSSMEAAYQEEMAILRAEEKHKEALKVSKSILDDVVNEAMEVSDNYWELFKAPNTSEKKMTSEDLWNMLSKRNRDPDTDSDEPDKKKKKWKNM